MANYYAYGKYRKTRNAAWDCLLDSQVRSLPVDLYQIANAQQVVVSRYSTNAEMLREKGYGPLLKAAGFSYADKDSRMFIFVDDLAPLPQLRFTIAHELGHILLGHMELSVPQSQLLLPSDPELEKEADRFAMRLLAPACALWALGAFSPSDIADVCGIPIERARDRSQRMRVLLRRDEWLTSRKERQLFQQMGFSRPAGGGPEIK